MNFSVLFHHAHSLPFFGFFAPRFFGGEDELNIGFDGLMASPWVSTNC